jgi:hypothetical protein
MRKKTEHFNALCKNNYFLPISIIRRLIPTKIPKKKFKTKAPPNRNMKESRNRELAKLGKLLSANGRLNVTKLKCIAKGLKVYLIYSIAQRA